MSKYFGLGASIVYQLTKPLHGKHHQVYFDNYFSTVPPMEYLLYHQVYCCGTIRSDRKYLPKNLQGDKTLQRGDFDHCVSVGGLVFYKCFTSGKTNFHGTEAATVLRTQKDGTRINFNCPVAVKDYNTFMEVSIRQIYWYHHVGYLGNPKSGGIEFFLVWLIEHYVMHLFISTRLQEQKWKVFWFEEW